MSNPFIFVPDASPHNSPFIPGSPFLPNATPSPFGNVIPLPAVHAGGQIPYDPVNGWQRAGHRRTPSWNPPLSAGAEAANFLHPMGHRPRTQSFGGIGGQGLETPIVRNIPPAMQLNPWLTPSGTGLWFDLTMSQFSPRYIVDAQGSQMPLPDHELALPATHPAVAGLHLVFDVLPQYPLDVSAGGAPLTLRHVFEAVYGFMQRQIAQDDYDMLGFEQKKVVAKAYTRRCNALGPAAAKEKERGIKRVDFLVGKVLFRGLVNDGRGLKVLTA
ncbi:hypothetical protein BDZ89DRAFT_594305 [Hymenopellis radicata]|nr:hypothetical protein BDZ89DRAFT_594305 [Hymenopellis radicata]